MLLYLYALKYRSQLLTARSIVSAIVILGLTAYIYYVGKTILLPDHIINGTDNLFVNGMYSTFLGTLSLSDLVTPWPDLYVRLHLGDEVTKLPRPVVTFSARRRSSSSANSFPLTRQPHFPFWSLLPFSFSAPTCS